MKVSIITPAYNQSEFIEETIESVLNQDYPNIEYIVLDDGSTDNIQEIVSPYLDRLTYVRHENIGESKTVNRGYALASGDLIGIVNADDPFFARDAVSRIVDSLRQQPDALAAYPDWATIDKVGNVLSHTVQPLFTIHNMLGDLNVTLGPGMFIKRLALEKVGLRNESLKYTGDLDMSFRLAMVGSFSHVPLLLATHRVHSSSASSSAQGVVMAREVLRLVTTSLASSSLPAQIRKNHRRVLANAYLAAAAFCGGDRGLAMEFRIRSALCHPGPLLLSRRSIATSVRPFLRRVVRFPMVLIRAIVPAKVKTVVREVVKKLTTRPMRNALARWARFFGFMD